MMEDAAGHECACNECRPSMLEICLKISYFITIPLVCHFRKALSFFCKSIVKEKEQLYNVSGITIKDY